MSNTAKANIEFGRMKIHVCIRMSSDGAFCLEAIGIADLSVTVTCTHVWDGMRHCMGYVAQGFTRPSGSLTHSATSLPVWKRPQPPVSQATSVIDELISTHYPSQYVVSATAWE